jgi:iron(III) transport system ATP-binding protein
VAGPDGQVHLGPLAVPLRHAAAPGRVKLAVRPEAWAIGAAAPGTLAGTLAKVSYLGGLMELTVAAPIGEIFVVSPDVARAWTVGEAVGLTLAGRGAVSVVGSSARGSGAS